MGVSITKVGNRFRARVEGPTVEGRRTFQYAFFGSKKEASKFRLAMEGGATLDEAKELATGAKPLPNSRGRKHCPTLREWGETFLSRAEALGTLRPQSIRQYQITLERHLYPVIGDLRLDRLTQPVVLEALASVARSATAKGHNKSGAAMSNTRARLCAVLSAAVPEHLPANPARGLKLGRRKRTAGRIMTPDQRRHLITQVKDQPLGPLIRFAVATGLRRGELAGLTWRHVDLDAGVVQVEVQAISAKGGGSSVAELKTEGSRRQLTLPSPIITELLALRAKAEDDAAWRSRNVGELPVFVNQAGKAWIPDCLTDAVARLLVRIGLKGYTLHDLRHIHASALLADRQNIKAVSRRMGHSDVRTTLEVYSHLLPQDDVALASSAAALLET